MNYYVEMIKLVFLDIDEVLNCWSMYKDGDTIIGTPGGKLSLRCLTVLNEFIGETSAKIVLSSTWRKDEYVEDYLYEAGLKGEIVGKTPFLGTPYTFRGNEIHAWLVQNEALLGKRYYDFYSYVIFDDNSDMLLNQREHFFQTDSHSGLTTDLAYKAKRFLNKFG